MSPILIHSLYHTEKPEIVELLVEAGMCVPSDSYSYFNPVVLDNESYGRKVYFFVIAYGFTHVNLRRVYGKKS